VVLVVVCGACGGVWCVVLVKLSVLEKGTAHAEQGTELMSIEEI
jgi:hypothetical protein